MAPGRVEFPYFRTQGTSSPEVAQVFERATAGIQPFSEVDESGFGWWPLAVAAAGFLAAVFA